MATKKTKKRLPPMTSVKDALLERVLAAPEDDALRPVWADALQERGDPRGEVIALQLAASGGAFSAGLTISPSWRRMTYAMPLARVPRRQVLRDEGIGIALVWLWDEYGALCCDNRVLSSRQPMLSDDPEQLIYMCLRRR